MSATEVKGDAEFKKFIAEAKKVDGAYVAIGLHEDAGSYESGVSVVEVGLWNEFGTETAPERSWMRSAIDEKREELEEFRGECLNKIADGQLTVRKALEMLGFRIQIILQNKIKSNVPPANAPSTMAHKEREGVEQTTLMESKLMLRSVTYKVYGV